MVAIKLSTIGIGLDVAVNCEELSPPELIFITAIQDESITRDLKVLSLLGQWLVDFENWISFLNLKRFSARLSRDEFNILLSLLHKASNEGSKKSASLYRKLYPRFKKSKFSLIENSEYLKFSIKKFGRDKDFWKHGITCPLLLTPERKKRLRPETFIKNYLWFRNRLLLSSGLLADVVTLLSLKEKIGAYSISKILNCSNGQIYSIFNRATLIVSSQGEVLP